jgi:hypothetical protein
MKALGRSRARGGSFAGSLIGRQRKDRALSDEVRRSVVFVQQETLSSWFVRHFPMSCITVFYGIRQCLFPSVTRALGTEQMVRQHLISMGQVAAQTVVDQIERRGEHVPEITIEPEFVVRKSMGPPSGARLGRLAEARNTWRKSTPLIRLRCGKSLFCTPRLTP